MRQPSTELINSTNGSLSISDTLIISSTTSPEAILTHFGTANIQVRDMENGWIHYTVWNIQKNDTYFVFTFMFDNNRLKMIDFILDNDIIVAGSWDNWSEADELQKKELFEKWLTGEMGATRKFSWGSAGVFYDPHGGFSSIGLKYE